MKRIGFVFSVIGLSSLSAITSCPNAFSAPSPIDQTRAQVEAYRISQSPAVMKLKDAPYPKFLLLSQMSEIYPALYGDEWEKLTTQPPLDLLFDELIQMIIDGKVPASMKDDVKAIGPRLAKNVQKGKGPNCVLDTSEKIVKVPTSALLALKLDVINAIPNCTYRKRIYNAAKAEIIKARKDPKILADLKKAAKSKFPALFDAEFKKTIADKVTNFSDLVIQKFGGEYHPIWSDNGSIVEITPQTPVIPGGKQIVTIEQFGRGLKADLDAAAILMKSKEKRDRGLAAGLFYASMNRLLMITGGNQIAIERGSLKLAATLPSAGTIGPQPNDPNVSPTPTPTPYRNGEVAAPVVPNLYAQAFGGWGAEIKDGKPVMTPWDWASYNPDADINPTAYRMIPARFAVDANGIPTILDEKDLVQTNAGIASLIQALAAFVRHTSPEGAFGKFFGSKDQVSDLLDPTKPLLFPKEGRLLALAILSGVAENLLEVNRGHVRMLMNPQDDKSIDETGKGRGVWPRFRDYSSFTDVKSTGLDILPLASLLQGAEELRLALMDDSQMKELEPKVEALAVQVQNLVQLGILEIANYGQRDDGTFRRTIYLSPEEAALQPADLEATIEVLLCLFKIYNRYEHPLYYLRIEAALKRGFVPLLKSSKLNAHLNGRLKQLWSEIQVRLPKDHPEDVPLREIEAAVRGVISL